MIAQHGPRWIRHLRHKHVEEANKAATTNGEDFKEIFNARMERIEQSQSATTSLMERALSHPGFWTLLQQAYVASSQTDEKLKHELFARLVTERLKVDSETNLALGVRQACDVITKLTKNQLLLLGLIATVTEVLPGSMVLDKITDEEYSTRVRDYLLHKLPPYKDIKISYVDHWRFASTGCIMSQQLLTVNVEERLSRPPRKFDIKKLEETRVWPLAHPVLERIKTGL